MAAGLGLVSGTESSVPAGCGGDWRAVTLTEPVYRCAIARVLQRTAAGILVSIQQVKCDSPEHTLDPQYFCRSVAAMRSISVSI